MCKYPPPSSSFQFTSPQAGPIFCLKHPKNQIKTPRQNNKPPQKKKKKNDKKNTTGESLPRWRPSAANPGSASFVPRCASARSPPKSGRKAMGGKCLGGLTVYGGFVCKLCSRLTFVFFFFNGRICFLSTFSSAARLGF